MAVKTTIKRKLTLSAGALIIVVLLLSAVTGSCQVSYLAQAVSGHLRIMHARQPIAKMLDGGKLDTLTAGKLKMVLGVRAFAVSELGLPDNKSYTVYAEVAGDYPGWNVFCTPEFSVEPKTWCYPVAGCVVYHGYFKKEKAIAFGEKMKKKGLDVYISPFSAYSTLGWYSDPVLSSNLRDDSVDLAGLILHELAHQKYYKSGDSRFSEGFAMTVERAGVLRWLKALGRNDQAAKAIRDWEAYDRRVDRLLQARNELEMLYGSGSDTSFMRVRKDSILRGLEAEQNIKSGRLNNAALVPVSTYHSLIAGFQATLDSCGGDFRKFYEAVKK